jgi:hypothetical protein
MQYGGEDNIWGACMLKLLLFHAMTWANIETLSFWFLSCRLDIKFAINGEDYFEE